MSTKTHTTAVVLIPPREVWEPIQAIRRAHDRQMRRWMPHITLVYPFRPVEEFAALAPALERALARLEPFEVELRGFRHFRHGARGHTIWLAPEPAEAIDRLQMALQKIVPDLDDVRRHREGFTPHLSVGQHAGPRRRVLDLLRSLDADWRPLRFRAGSASLIRRGEPPDDVFRVEREIPIGGAAGTA